MLVLKTLLEFYLVHLKILTSDKSNMVLSKQGLGFAQIIVSERAIYKLFKC